MARDGRIPGWLRGAVAFGLLPIPGPVDEIVLVLVAGVLWLGYREQLREAWTRAGEPMSEREAVSAS